MGNIDGFIIEIMVDTKSLNKLKLTGQNLGQVFNSRQGPACIRHPSTLLTKQPNFKLKTQSKQLLGSFLLAFALLTEREREREGERE